MSSVEKLNCPDLPPAKHIYCERDRELHMQSSGTYDRLAHLDYYDVVLQLMLPSQLQDSSSALAKLARMPTASFQMA